VGEGLTPSSSQRPKVYARLKRRLWVLDLALTGGFLTAILVSGFAQRLSSWVSARIVGSFVQVALYTSLLGLGWWALSLPLDGYRSFVLEHRFGLSTQRFGQWFMEHLKQFVVGGILSLIVVEGLVALMRNAPKNWWLWATLLWIGWSSLLTHLGPTLLIPLFYRQRPLEDAALRQRLELLLRRCGARVGGIFEVNLSKTTRKANACLCGLGYSRRVLVSDTLLSAYPPEEVEVVLAHELGHHRLHHLGILILMGSITAGFSCLVVDQVARLTLGSLGILGLQDLAVLPLIGLILFLVGLVLMPLTHGVSRWLEAQADRFALEQTRNPKAFITTMLRLAEQNLSEVEPPRWVEILLYDHPSISKRIALAQRYGG